MRTATKKIYRLGLKNYLTAQTKNHSMNLLNSARFFAVALAGSSFLPACVAQENPAPAPIPQNAAILAPNVKMISTGGTGWAKSSVNAAIFRTNSLVTHGNTQYVAFYDGDANVVLGQAQTGFGRVGNAKDAISGQRQGRAQLDFDWCRWSGHFAHGVGYAWPKTALCAKAKRPAVWK